MCDLLLLLSFADFPFPLFGLPFRQLFLLCYLLLGMRFHYLALTNLSLAIDAGLVHRRTRRLLQRLRQTRQRI